MGKYERNMGNDGKPWENIMEKPWENIGNYGETMGKPQEYGKIGEKHGEM